MKFIFAVLFILKFRNMQTNEFDFESNTGKKVNVISDEKTRNGILLGLMPDNIVLLDISEHYEGQMAISEYDLDEIIEVNLAV